MPNKIFMPALLIMVLALVPCLAGTPAWASADHRIGQSGDFTMPFELAQDDNPINDIRPTQFLKEGNIALGREDATDADQNDIILASQQNQAPSSSNACVAISPVSNLGTLYLGIPRDNDSQNTDPCRVDLTKVAFYLNAPECNVSNECRGSLSSGDVCRFPLPSEANCDVEDPSVPCIDKSDVQALVNSICTPDNAACNECINWETGSPNCVDYRTSSGFRVKMCTLENGKTCPWKKCCKKKLHNDPKCKVE